MRPGIVRELRVDLGPQAEILVFHSEQVLVPDPGQIRLRGRRNMCFAKTE